jgi:hypothetical protein
VVPLVVVPVAPVHVAQGPVAEGPQRWLRGGRVRHAPGLELGAQPVHVGEDLAAQLPSLRTSGRIGGEQVGELVLLPLSLLEMVFQRLGDRLGREGGELAGHRVGLE